MEHGNGQIHPLLSFDRLWSSRRDRDGKTRCLPFRKTVDQATRRAPACPQSGHRLEGEDAVRPAAVGDHLAVRIEFGKPVLQLAQRDVHGAGEMPVRELVRRADVEHGHQSGPDPVQQLLARDRFETVPLGIIAAADAIHLRQVSLGLLAQCGQKADHPVISQPVQDELALAAVRNEPGAAKLLQMLGRIGEGKADAVRQRLDAPLALPKMLQKLQPVRVADRASHSGELGKDRLLGPC